MAQTALKPDFYFSQFLGRRVYDDQGRVVGKVLDMAVRWSGDSPVATCIKFAKGFQSHIDMSSIGWFAADGPVLNKPLTAVIARALQDDEFYVSKWLMDKQIIDRTGAKLVRVNDIKLTWNQHALALVAVDIGIKGLFRRIGLEWLVQRYPDKFLEWQYITPLESKIANLKLRREYAELGELHPADVADIMEDLDHKERHDLIDMMDDETAADALTEADLKTQVQIISQMDEERASDILEEMPADEAADILGALPEDKSSQLLSRMDVDDAEDVRELMAYEEEVAGSMMTTEFIVFAADLTAAQTIERLRALAPEAETIYYIYVVDEHTVLQGICSLRELILAPADTRLGSFMHTRVISVGDTAKRQEVYDVILKYNLLAVPVVGKSGMMLGIITVDDVLHAVMATRSKLKTFSHFMLASRKEEG